MIQKVHLLPIMLSALIAPACALNAEPSPEAIGQSLAAQRHDTKQTDDSCVNNPMCLPGPSGGAGDYDACFNACIAYYCTAPDGDCELEFILNYCAADCGVSPY